MTDVQVSNARRIGFTAFALVSFWVLAWNAYWMGLDISPGFGRLFMWGVWAGPVPLNDLGDSLVVGFVMAPLPTLALWISVRRKGLPALFCGLLFGLSISFAFWLSLSDWDTAVNAGMIGRNDVLVSWFRLLLPIIATTAFVIFGAWRRAVRDAEVGAVDEDECRLTDD